MSAQRNSRPEEGSEPKFEVGARLVFRAYAPDEEWSVGDERFEPGDVLVVEPVNGCGLGIDVRRERDGRVDMVWPEEVELEAQPRTAHAPGGSLDAPSALCGAGGFVSAFEADVDCSACLGRLLRVARGTVAR